MNKIKDGKIAGFLVTDISQGEQEFEFKEGDMVGKRRYTKYTIKLTHDARTSKAEDYASQYDPSTPLVLTIKAYVNQTTRSGCDKTPEKWRGTFGGSFVPWERFAFILRQSGYVNKDSKFPLPGQVFVRLGLNSSADNYPKEFGGKELLDSQRLALEQLDTLFAAPAISQPLDTKEETGLDKMMGM